MSILSLTSIVKDWLPTSRFSTGWKTGACYSSPLYRQQESVEYPLVHLANSYHEDHSPPLILGGLTLSRAVISFEGKTAFPVKESSCPS